MQNNNALYNAYVIREPRIPNVRLNWRTQLMNEKIYKTMASSGAGSLALGIVVLVTGLVTGILMIVNGARLLKRKSDILI